jgi:hypothetical protein
MGSGRGCQGSMVAVAPQVEGLFWFDVDAGGQSRWSQDVSSGKKQDRSPKTIPNEDTPTDILVSDEPKQREIVVPMASPPTMNRPLAAANGHSLRSNPSCNLKGGDSGERSSG